MGAVEIHTGVGQSWLGKGMHQLKGEGTQRFKLFKEILQFLEDSQI